MRLASRSHAPLDSPNQGASPPPKQLLWIWGIESESGTWFAGIFFEGRKFGMNTFIIGV